jgi:hypothetical protein
VCVCVCVVKSNPSAHKHTHNHTHIHTYIHTYIHRNTHIYISIWTTYGLFFCLDTCRRLNRSPCKKRGRPDQASTDHTCRCGPDRCDSRTQHLSLSLTFSLFLSLPDSQTICICMYVRYVSTYTHNTQTHALIHVNREYTVFCMGKGGCRCW